MQDWLGNELEIGGLVLYSSKSQNTGMNLGELVYAGADKIQIRILDLTSRYNGTAPEYSRGRLVTLHRGNGAYKSVTRYFGKVSNLGE